MNRNTMYKCIKIIIVKLSWCALPVKVFYYFAPIFVKTRLCKFGPLCTILTKNGIVQIQLTKATTLMSRENRLAILIVLPILWILWVCVWMWVFRLCSLLIVAMLAAVTNSMSRIMYKLLMRISLAWVGLFVSHALKSNRHSLLLA